METNGILYELLSSLGFGLDEMSNHFKFHFEFILIIKIVYIIGIAEKFNNLKYHFDYIQFNS